MIKVQNNTFRIMKKLLILLPSLLIALTSCDSIKRGEVDARPQVYFDGTSFVISKDEIVKIPVKLQEAPSGNVEVSYKLSSIDKEISFEEFTTTPEVLSFTPTRKTDTIFLQSNTTQKESVNMILALNQIPDGYREGLVNYVTLNFLGSSSFFISFASETEYLNRMCDVTLNLLNDRNRAQRALKELSYTIEVDHQRSSAVEGVHFDFPEGKEVSFKVRDRNASVPIRMLKHEVGREKIILNLIPVTGTQLGRIATMNIVIKPIDFSGKWNFESFENGDMFSWMEDMTLEITGAEGDNIVITPSGADELNFEFNISGTLKQILPAKSKGTFVREFRNVMGDFSEPLTVYQIENINVAASPNEQVLKTAQVGFTIVKEDDGTETLHISFFDLKPVGFFKEVYGIFDDGTYGDFPLLGTAPRYTFKK